MFKKYCIVVLILSISNLFVSSLLALRKKEQWINIIVHGSVGLQSSLNMSTVRRLIRDKVDGSFYQQNVLSMRHNPELFTLQPIDRLGLYAVPLNFSLESGAYLYSYLYDFISKRYFPEQYNKFYTFGWSGLVSCKQRFQEAKNLYKELRKRFNNKYRIRIIGYSHGATLAFNLAAVRELYYPKDNFAIDEIIAIGMPVLSKTEKLASHEMFKKVYHIYSKSDWVQHLDIFSPGNFTSHKTFSNFNMPKLKQVQINVFAKNQNNNNRMWRSAFLDQSPSHIELWFFGWPPNSYNRNLYLCPLPVSVFIPYILYIVNKCAYSRSIELSLYPDCEFAQVKNKYCVDFLEDKVFKFVSISDLNFLKDYAYQFYPEKRLNKIKYAY